MSAKRIDRWRRSIRYSDLPPVARHVALEISVGGYMDHETLGGAHPGPALLAKRTGWSERTIKRALKVLVSEGWLRQVYRGGGDHGPSRNWASIYQGTFPREDKESRETVPDSHTKSPRTTSQRAGPEGRPAVNDSETVDVAALGRAAERIRARWNGDDICLGTGYKSVDAYLDAMYAAAGRAAADVDRIIGQALAWLGIESK